jgi:hypothetical protein
LTRTTRVPEPARTFQHQKQTSRATYTHTMFSPYSSVTTIAAGLTCLGLLVGFGISHNSRCHHSVTTDPATIITHADDDQPLDAKMADKARDQEMTGHSADDDDNVDDPPEDSTL